MVSGNESDEDLVENVKLVIEAQSPLVIGGGTSHDFTHQIKLARECKSDWETMKGNDCLRQCQQCSLWVWKTEDLSEDNLHQMLEANSGTIGFSTISELRLFRRRDGAFSLGDCLAKRRAPIWAAAFIFLLPLFAYGMAYAFAPGYIIPLLNHPVAQLLVIGSIVWHALGCLLFGRTTNLTLRTLIVLCFTTPMIVLPIIGPLCETELMQAIGPITPYK